MNKPEEMSTHSTASGEDDPSSSHKHRKALAQAHAHTAKEPLWTAVGRGGLSSQQPQASTLQQNWEEVGLVLLVSEDKEQACAVGTGDPMDRNRRTGAKVAGGGEEGKKVGGSGEEEGENVKRDKRVEGGRGGEGSRWPERGEG